jgi:hypothetical protein
MAEVDNVIAQASEEATAQPASIEAAPQVEKVKEVEKEEVEDIGKKPDSELTPEQLAKREANRRSHENSKLAEMRRANRELQAKLSQFEQTQNQPKQTQETPKDPAVKTIDDFATWEEWTDYQLEQKLEAKLSAKDKQAQEAQRTQEFDKWKDERGSHIDKRVEELASIIPDLGQELDEIEDNMVGISPEMGMVILNAEDINLAAYALKKEGGIEAVNRVLQLPPLQAAAEIAKAEVRGQAYLQQKPTTNAPTPLTPARGNTGGGTSIEKMDGVQLLRSLRKKG